jgi:exopolyphosphatase/guanosine-5'-triphosphate,3'-diphosphate pyrophosphatase
VRVAAIDCGTNSIRLLVADSDEDGTLVDVVRDMKIVRLGQDVDRTGRLAPEAIERTRVALAGYAATIRELGAEPIRMAATSASRDASNRDDFVAMVRTTLGQDPEVITGAEEARLSFTGAAGGLSGIAPPVLVVDLGGGSTELVLGVQANDTLGSDDLRAYSMDIGSVRMTERHLHDDPPTDAQIAAAVADIEAAIDVAERTVPIRDAATFVGVAGTITTVAGLALELPEYDSSRIHGLVLSRADVDRVAEQLLHATHDERAALPSLHPGRVDVIGAGALVLRTLMRRIGAEELIVSEHDILDGIALSLL